MRLSFTLVFVACAALAAQTALPRIAFIDVQDARPAVQLLATALPDDLKGKNLAAVESIWPDWTRKRDAQIRGRLAQGDEDSLVNLMLFGTSFTSQPRLTAHEIQTIIDSSKDPAVSGARLDAVTQARLDDFIRAAAAPKTDERFTFAQRALSAKGFALSSPDGQRKAKAHLLRALSRVLGETDAHNRSIAEAEQSKAPGTAFARRSGLYRDRGLSSDTSIAPNFAIEEALKAIRAKGILPSPIRRVAIVGAGLDFADKQEGYDFYPVQTMQPFAVIDSLLRLRLSSIDDVRVTTLDLGPRVNAHLEGIALRSGRGQPYVLQLPLDATEKWQKPFFDYWTAFGDQIGTPDKPLAAPAGAGAVDLRAVRVRPAVGARIAPIDLDVVLQRLELPPQDKFDLVIATNVFLYYSEFERALAMANMQAMIRPGGVLLSNNALVELPASRLRFVGETTVEYSERKDNGDTIVWYQWSE